MYIRANSGSGGGSGSSGFLLYFGRGSSYDTTYYEDTNFADYASRSKSGYTQTITFKKKVKGIVITGPYSTSVTGTASSTFVQILIQPSSWYSYSFEADVNDTITAGGAGWSDSGLIVFITEG